MLGLQFYFSYTIVPVLYDHPFCKKVAFLEGELLKVTLYINNPVSLNLITNKNASNDEIYSVGIIYH
jgi:hypothetical protein